MLIEQLSLPGGIINGAPSTKKVKKTKKSLSTDRDYVYKPVHEQDTYEINQQLQQADKLPIVQRIALVNQIRRALGEEKIDEQVLDKLKQIAKDKLPFVTPTSDYEGGESEAFRDDISKISNIMIPGLDVAKDVVINKIVPKVKDWGDKKLDQKATKIFPGTTREYWSGGPVEEGTIAGFHTLQENGIAKINGHEMGVEIQSTPEGLEKGLMFRKEIPSGKGMLLKFGKDHPAKIWMKNVKQPLDIIYIKDNQVEDLFRNAMPDMGDGIFDSIGEVMCDMVLELPAGDIEKFDIKPGDMFGFNDLRKQGIAN